MKQIMDGEATPAQIGAFITALRMKGETVDEITGCAEAMRENADRITPAAEPLVDTCGTGGDGANTFNISTAAAFVVAGGGRSRRQARQPLRLEPVRQRRRPGGSRRPHRPDRRARSRRASTKWASAFSLRRGFTRA